MKKRTRNGFLDIKPFWDLSLATKLALEQVSVINHLRRGRYKEGRSSQETIGQPWGSVLFLKEYA